MMTKEQAQSAVERALRERNLTMRLTASELLNFCQEMHSCLQFRSKSDPLSEIRGWTENWEDRWLR